jgi:hypothetical protein
VIFYSCNKEDFKLENLSQQSESLTEIQTNNENVFKVSEEEAISSALRVLQNTNLLRSSELGTVGSIEIVSDETLTGQSSGLLQSDSLFYLINFDAGGFAVVSADKRSSSIYAYSDEGSFHLSDTTYNKGLKIFLENSKINLLNDIIEFTENHENDSIISITVSSGDQPITKVGLIMDQTMDILNNLAININLI